jgi:hypothetical protein
MKPGLTVWLTADEAAAHMKFPTVRAFYRWFEKTKIPHGKIGRSLRFEARVLDAYIRGDAWTERRSA